MKNSHIFNTLNAADIKAISITGKRWFQRSYGNTYHSVSVGVLVNRETAHRINPAEYAAEGRNVEFWIDLAYVSDVYGYERHFENTALVLLNEAVIDAPEEWRKLHYICQVATALDVPYSENVYDVNRKKDL